MNKIEVIALSHLTRFGEFTPGLLDFKIRNSHLTAPVNTERSNFSKQLCLCTSVDCLDYFSSNGSKFDLITFFHYAGKVCRIQSCECPCG